MKRSELRVKVASLVSERKIILSEMHRVDRIGMRHLAGTTRHEALWQTWRSLNTHRIALAVEVRAALLATAFLRGRAYADVERFALTDPPLVAVHRIVEKFGGTNSGLIATRSAEVGAFTERWIAWHTAALAHVATFPAARKARADRRRDRRVDAHRRAIARQDGTPVPASMAFRELVANRSHRVE